MDPKLSDVLFEDKPAISHTCITQRDAMWYASAGFLARLLFPRRIETIIGTARDCSYCAQKINAAMAANEADRDARLYGPTD